MSIFSLFKTIPKVKIVDVGAGDFGWEPSYNSLLENDLASLIGFEPDEKACKKLNEKKINKNCQFFPYFIGDGKIATFYETNWAATGSIFPPNTLLLEKFQNLSELVTPVAQHKVKTMRLDDIPEIERIDFLKMDIQGGELSALSNAPNHLKTTLIVQAEVEFIELYKGQPLFSDVDSFLRSQGFQFHCFTGGLLGRTFKPLVVNNELNKKINQHLWSDAVYVKDWMTLEKLSENQLIIYAILANEVLKSPDLSHLVLQQIDKLKNSKYADAFLKSLTS